MKKRNSGTLGLELKSAQPAISTGKGVISDFAGRRFAGCLSVMFEPDTSYCGVLNVSFADAQFFERHIGTFRIWVAYDGSSHNAENARGGGELAACTEALAACDDVVKMLTLT